MYYVPGPTLPLVPLVPLALQPVSVSAAVAQLSAYDMIPVCRLLFMRRCSIGVGMSDGRRGRRDKVWQDRHLQPSRSCQTARPFQRYCSSAVIMIGALQVVLEEGMHHAAIFISTPDRRLPLPRLAPRPHHPLSDGETFPLGKIGLQESSFEDVIFWLCPTCPAAPAASHMAAEQPRGGKMGRALTGPGP